MWLTARPEAAPNARSYCSAIDACAKAAAADEASALLLEMVGAGIGHHVYAYAAVASACGKAGQWERGLQMLEAARTAGLQPNAVLYGSVMAGCAAAGKVSLPCASYSDCSTGSCV
jgi:pentatricopeptide repeat domain-containing protein 1